MAGVQGKKKNKKGKKGGPEMVVNDLGDEKKLHRHHGMSLDMGSPYIIPGNNIAPSRSSFNSTSRSAHGNDDPYQAISLLKSPSRSASAQPKPKAFMSQGSDENPQNSTTNLLRGAQKPSRDSPPQDMASLTTRSSSPTNMPSIAVPEPSHSLSRKPVGLRKPGSNDESSPEGAESPQPPPAPPKDGAPASNFSLPKNVDRSSISTQGTANAPHDRASSPPPPLPLPQRASSKGPAMQSSGGVNSNPLDDYQTYADVLGIAQLDSKPSPTTEQDPNASLPTIHEPGTRAPRGDGLAVPEQDNRRYSAGLRPLPSVDPADNAEQRANRIRSFYKEYFEETYHGDDYDNYDYGEYYEDYGQEYLNGATIWDPETGQFVMAGGAPYAQPVTRRAMTPPPRGPPRFRAGPGGHRFTSSSGQSHAGGRARAFSSASGRPQAGGRGRPPKRRLPPPGPLSNLPTPHLLKTDQAAFSAIDFAPPSIFKDQREGRSASPRMDARPFSPSVRAHTPLTSFSQDLAVMPSP